MEFICFFSIRTEEEGAQKNTSNIFVASRRPRLHEIACVILLASELFYLHGMLILGILLLEALKI